MGGRGAGGVKDGLWPRFVAWMNHSGRNDTVVDEWSGVHLVTGVWAGWLMDPFIALLIMVLWEPLEMLVLNPLFERWWGIEFGFESLRNAMSDIVFNAAGVALGYWGLRAFVEPPFVLF